MLNIQRSLNTSSNSTLVCLVQNGVRLIIPVSTPFSAFSISRLRFPKTSFSAANASKTNQANRPVMLKLFSKQLLALRVEVLVHHRRMDSSLELAMLLSPRLFVQHFLASHKNLHHKNLQILLTYLKH